MLATGRSVSAWSAGACAAARLYALPTPADDGLRDRLRGIVTRRCRLPIRARTVPSPMNLNGWAETICWPNIVLLVRPPANAASDSTQ